MIHLDTNFLILAMVPNSAQDRQLRAWIGAGRQVRLSVIVWTEFLCGPVAEDQARVAAEMFPNPEPFLPADAVRAADLFNHTGRKRGTLIDCMIAAACMVRGAELATEDIDDFRRFNPMGLRLAAAG